MAGSARGSDLSSWWSNRAALRTEAHAVIGQLRDCQKRLGSAAGGASAGQAVPLSEQSSAAVATAASQLLAKITQTHSDISQLAPARSAAQANFAGTKQQIDAAAGRRVHEQAQKDAERSVRSRKAMGWATQKLCRIAAAAVFAAMLYILFVY